MFHIHSRRLAFSSVVVPPVSSPLVSALVSSAATLAQRSFVGPADPMYCLVNWPRRMQVHLLEQDH